jgi:hypothetical protein
MSFCFNIEGEEGRRVVGKEYLMGALAYITGSIRDSIIPLILSVLYILSKKI